MIIVKGTEYFMFYQRALASHKRPSVLWQPADN